MAPNKKAIRYLALRVLCLALSIPGSAFAQESHLGNLTGNAEAGKQLFQRYCIGCHGPKGDAKGENAPFVVGPLQDPLPRNFVLGLFKCRSTPTGTLPLDSDLYDTIGRGIYTTYMPPWRALTSQQRVDLIAHVSVLGTDRLVKRDGNQRSRRQSLRVHQRRDHQQHRDQHRQ